MAEIKSFKALRYNPIKVSDISTVIAPPYDVITKDQQDALYELNENNVIRVDLNKEPGDKKYTMAKEIFETWQKKEILTEDIRDSIYPYYQKFDYEGLEYERIGIVALVKLHEFKDKVILPHEETFSGPKEDRLKLFNEVGAQFSQIFSLYNDEDKKIER